MKISDILECGVGRVVKGVNTTQDVGPGEIRTQAAKFGFDVTNDGVPPNISTTIKKRKKNITESIGLLPFYSNCVEWPMEYIDVLHHIIDTAVEITRDEFLLHVNKTDMRNIERDLGYNASLPMQKDYHVNYFKLNDYPVVFFIHSAIEYVFGLEETIWQIDDALLDQMVADDDQEGDDI